MKIKHDEFQELIMEKLGDIFGGELVRSEWDSVAHDGHTANHKSIYAPRHDVAVGPFNSNADLDIGNDKTWKMRNHPFIKELIEKQFKHREVLEKVWNRNSRCLMAIEIDFSGSSKHLMGSIINSAVSGSIGIIITNEEKFKKIERISNYILRLDGFETLQINLLRNLIIFKNEEFLELLKKFE